jgi:peptide/nickel transport system permease protein
MRRFRRNRLAMVGLVAVATVAILAVLAPVVSPYDPNKIDVRAFGKPPSAAHLLGTDNSGRDILSRVIWGGRVSVAVGLGAVAIYLVIGTFLGALSGYVRGLVDSVIMRATDTFLAFPTLIIIMAVVPLLGHSVANIVFVIGVFGWPTTARLVRGEFLSLREREFVTAARSIGVRPAWIVLRHILPNVGSSLAVVASFGVADAIIAESGLSLLGLGIQPPDASWGQMLTVSMELATVVARPWGWISPAVALAITVLSINFVGDGLRDALDPRADARAR